MAFSKPEAENAPYQISAAFFDDNLNKIFEIQNNEITIPTTVYDMEQIGNKFKIWNRRGKISLLLECNSDIGIIIHKIAMQFRGYKILGDTENGLSVSKNQKPVTIIRSTSHIEGTGKNIGIQVGENNSLLSSSVAMYLPKM